MSLNREEIRKELLKLGTLKVGDHEYVLTSQPAAAPAGGNGFILFARTSSVPVSDVAIKVFLPANPKWQQANDPSRKRFLQEIEILTALDHPNIVKCLDHGDVTVAGNQLPCYVMPKARGSMRDRLDAGEFREDETVCRDFFLPLAEALLAVHEKVVYHRDIKPENVLIGDGDIPLLADFGIAHVDPGFVKKLVETRPADQLHNMHYYAPEQRKGQDATKVDHRADIWAFGYLLLEALTGRYPMGPNTFLPSQVHSEWLAFDYIVLKCTEIKADRRYQSMADCYNDLSTAFRGQRFERDALADFFAASRRVEFTAQLNKRSAELLFAETLRALYLNRSLWQPRGAGRDLVFASLLLRGGGGYHEQRLRNPDTPESESAPGSLGWYWFSGISKLECLAMLGHSLGHPNVHVRAGAARALGFLGTRDDAVQLARLLDERNPTAVVAALRSLASLGRLDHSTILRFINDQKKAEARQACAEALGTGIIDEAVAAGLLAPLLDDKNEAVRREAALSLAKLHVSDTSILEKLATLASFDLDAQVRQSAARAARVLGGFSELPRFDSHQHAVYDTLSRKDLVGPYSPVRERAAWDLLQHGQGAPAWDAATLWIAKYQQRESAERQMEILAPSLHFRALQALDFRMYSPAWWRDKMDPVGALVP